MLIEINNSQSTHINRHAGLGGCVAILKSTIKTVMPAKAGIQNILKILDSVSRSACTE